MSSSTFPHFATNAIHVGQEPEKWNSHAVVPPISCATTYKQTAPGEHKGYDYSRAGNPTRECLEQCLASLENAKYASAFASGLAASAAVFGFLNSGDHVLCFDDVYGGTNRYLKRIASKNGITHTRVDMTQSISEIEKHFQPSTKLIWLETPTNPLMKLCDISAIAEWAHRHPGVRVVVDNTFMSPYFQRPLDLGADAVVHSITKYINGHSDVVMGCVMTNETALGEHLRFFQLAAGFIASPFDCFLVNRGIKTLHVRMRQHMLSAVAVASFLEADPRVERVFFPELKSHPQHELHKRQAKGMSGMISFYLRGGLKEANTFLSKLQIFTLAESLGGYESLAEHPAIMTHASVPPNERAALGIGDNLVRLSIGLEDVDDLIDDLKKALDASCGPIDKKH